jgi:carboxymethylenebutenolidase
MIESMAEIETPDGRMDSFVCHPEQGGPFPSVFILMDIWGLREELFDIARKVAVTGYHCIVPNFWYRQGRVRFEHRDAKDRMLSLEQIPDAARQAMRKQIELVSDEMAMADIKATLEFLRTQPVSDGPKGAIGYCLGGRYAFQVAALYPDHFSAVASLHGTRLVSDQPLSPHKLAAQCRGEIYCAFAEHDDFGAPPIRQALLDAYSTSPNVKYHPMLHKAAVHGYALPNRDIYEKQAANRDWEAIFAMFSRSLTASRQAHAAA